MQLLRLSRLSRLPRLLASLLALVVIAAACGSAGSADSADSGSGSGEPELARIDEAAIGALEGKPVVVNFFASWCPSCVSELPDFQAVHEAMGDQVTFLGVANRDRPSDALALIERTGVTYEIGNDPDGELFEAFNALAMPTTVFVGADGEIVRTFSGVLDTESLTDIINEELL